MTINEKDQDHLIPDEDQDRLIPDEDQDHLIPDEGQDRLVIDTLRIGGGQDQGRGDVVMTTRGERGEGLVLLRGGGGATGLGAEDTPPVGGAGNRFINNNTHTIHVHVHVHLHVQYD